MSRLLRDEERRLADGLRAAIEAFEAAQRESLRQLRDDLQSALWPADASDEQPQSEGTRYG